MSSDLSDWTSRPAPSAVVLEGSFCRLEPLDPVVHADGLFKALMIEAAENDHLYLFETAMTRADFQTWIEAKAQRKDILCHVVIDKKSGLIGGRQDYMRIDQVHGVIEIGSIHWGPSIAKSPVTTEALYLHASHAFDTLGYRRYEWKCNDLNAPSKRSALRFGFTYEGLFRQHMVAKGRNRDTAWFSIVDQEWPALRKAYEAWLSPDNFGADGSQKQKLSTFMPIKGER